MLGAPFTDRQTELVAHISASRAEAAALKSSNGVSGVAYFVHQESSAGDDLDFCGRAIDSGRPTFGVRQGDCGRLVIGDPPQAALLGSDFCQLVIGGIQIDANPSAPGARRDRQHGSRSAERI